MKKEFEIEDKRSSSSKAVDILNRVYDEKKAEQSSSKTHETKLKASGNNIIVWEHPPDLEYSSDKTTGIVSTIIKADAFASPNQKATVIHCGEHITIDLKAGDTVFLRAHAAIGNSVHDPISNEKFIIVDVAEVLCKYEV